MPSPTEYGNQSPLLILCFLVHKRGTNENHFVNYKSPYNSYDMEAMSQNIAVYTQQISEFLNGSQNTYDRGRLELYKVSLDSGSNDIELLNSWSIAAPAPKTFINGKNKDPNIKAKLQKRSINTELPASPELNPTSFGEAQTWGTHAVLPFWEVPFGNMYAYDGSSVRRYAENPFPRGSLAFHLYNKRRTGGSSHLLAMGLATPDVAQELL